MDGGLTSSEMMPQCPPAPVSGPEALVCHSGGCTRLSPCNTSPNGQWRPFNQSSPGRDESKSKNANENENVEGQDLVPLAKTHCRPQVSSSFTRILLQDQVRAPAPLSRAGPGRSKSSRTTRFHWFVLVFAPGRGNKTRKRQEDWETKRRRFLRATPSRLCSAE